MLIGFIAGLTAYGVIMTWQWIVVLRAAIYHDDRAKKWCCRSAERASEIVTLNSLIDKEKAEVSILKEELRVNGMKLRSCRECRINSDRMIEDLRLAIATIRKAVSEVSPYEQDSPCSPPLSSPCLPSSCSP